MRDGEINEEIERVISRLAGLDLPAADAAAMVKGKGGGRLSPDRTLALIAFDADAVQEQIFASPRPVTIQGASLRLRQWDQDLLDGKILGHRAVVLFAGGGQAMLLARAGDAEDVRRELAQAFRQRTGSSPSTTASLALSPRELAFGGPRAQRVELTVEQQKRLGWSPQPAMGFGACMARLARELRREKGTPKEHPFLEEASAEARCAECGERPRRSDDRCERCQQNRNAGVTGKGAWEQAQRFDDVLGEPAPEGDGSHDDGRRARHIAYLRLDGKGIGAVLERVRTIAQYSAISRCLRHAFEVEYDLPALGVPSGRYQLPIAGGDDLLLIVPARWTQPSGAHGDALSLCAALLERVERVFETPGLEGIFSGDTLAGIRKIGAGAGVVIASGLPAKLCFDHAGELLRSAKDVITGEPGARSAVDFAVLREGSAVSSSLTEVRNTGEGVAELDLGGALTGKVRKTRCPYPLAAFNDMLSRARLLAHVSRASLRALRAGMAEPTTGMMAVRDQLALDPALRRALIEGAPLSMLEPELSEWILSPIPANHGGNDPRVPRWTSALPDLLDALRFVGASASSEEASAQAASDAPHLFPAEPPPEGMVVVEVEALEPLLLGELISASNRLDSFSYVPGSALLGALSNAAARQGSGDGFEEVFVDPRTSLVFSDALPAAKGTTELPVVVPRSSLECKHRKRQDHLGAAPARRPVDGLLSLSLSSSLIDEYGGSAQGHVCAVCGAPLQPARDIWPYPAIAQRVVTRLVRDVPAGAEMLEVLHAVTQVEAGTVLIGTAARVTPRALSRLKALADTDLRIGRGRSRGQGRIKLTLRLDERNLGLRAVQDRIKHYNHAVEDYLPLLGKRLPVRARVGGAVAVLARSDIAVSPASCPERLMQAIFQRDASKARSVTVQQATGTRSAWSEEDSGDKAGARQLTQVVLAGSVWLFVYEAGVSLSPARLARLEVEGIGDGTELGLGKIVVNHTLLRS